MSGDVPGEPEEDQVGTAEPLDPLDPGRHTALPPKVEAWRKRSATGAILTGFALGLQHALEKAKEEPSIVVQTSGDPPEDLPVEAEFEYGRPRHSVVSIRPWLLNNPNSGPKGTGGEPRGGDSGGNEPGDGPPGDSRPGDGNRR